MILLLLTFIFLALTCVFYWLKYQQEQRLHATRIKRYLNLATEKPIGSA